MENGKDALIHGKIVCQKVRSPRTIRSVIERHVRNWIQHQKAKSEVPSDHATYFVVFADDGNGEVVNCSVEIRVGNRLWRGRDLAHGLQQALFRSLKNLAPVPT